MKSSYIIFFILIEFIFFILIAFISFSGCNDTVQLTIPIIQDEVEIESDDYMTPFGMLSNELSATFMKGEEAFQKDFLVEEGLGPIVNNTSCVGCHPGNGRGISDLALIRFSRGHDLMIDMGGPQFQDKTISDVPYEVLPTGVDKSTRLPPPVFGVGLIENIPVERYCLTLMSLMPTVIAFPVDPTR